MKVFGLTGGIASGKSTVASMFQELGIQAIDADVMAKEVLQPGQPGYTQVVKIFGRKILVSSPFLEQPPIDPKVLAQIIFKNKEARRELESVVHPEIVARSRQSILALQQQGTSIVLYEATLLCETGRYREFDGLIVVDVPEEIQIQRAMARGLSRKETMDRIHAQASRNERLSVATWVIDNSKTLESTKMQVQALFHRWQTTEAGTHPL